MVDILGINLCQLPAIPRQDLIGSNLWLKVAKMPWVWRHDTQHNDTQHNDTKQTQCKGLISDILHNATQNNDSAIMLSVAIYSLQC
jgi:hypothetical protein